MTRSDVAIVGAGFAGLAAAYELTKRGLSVQVLEADDRPGGLAGTFAFPDGVVVEKFYHHWFNSDAYVTDLVAELGLEGEVILLPSRTGMYLNGRLWKLSTPLDLLRFTALSLPDRVRLGLLVLKVRRITDWRSIEHLSIREWLEPLVGPTVYRVVWEPLVDAKFSVFAEAVNAVWMWKKLALRGSTRDSKGGEELAYFKGGFGRLAEKLAEKIREQGGTIDYGRRVTGVSVAGASGADVPGAGVPGAGGSGSGGSGSGGSGSGGSGSGAGAGSAGAGAGVKITALETDAGSVEADRYLLTPAFPVIADMLEGAAEPSWLATLRRVKYLGNMCLVLRLDRSLSDTYWLNVNDPGFPFVGVIEHTNFDSPANYAGSHIAYLSRYLATEDPVWAYDDDAYLAFALGHLRRMFPDFSEDWVIDHAVWRSEHAQPVTERGYSSYVPGRETPFSNLTISTMAQIYPEDRGTNYAIREGRDVARRLSEA